MTLLSARGLGKEYGKGDGLVRAVRDVDLDVGNGETVAVMGPSGCGKSTLLHLLGGLDRPSTGEIRLAGQRLDQMGERGLLAAVALVTAIPARFGARRPVVPILRAAAG